MRSDENMLIQQAQNGDSAAENEILIKYSALVKSIARSYYVIGVDNDDIIQSGMIGLMNAVRSYDTQNGSATFKTYATTCIHNLIKTTLRKHQSKSNDIAPLSAILDMTDGIDIEDEYAKNESGQMLLTAIESVLNERERSVLQLFLNAMSYQEISDKLSITKKQVDNTIYLMRKKIKKLLDKGN